MPAVACAPVSDDRLSGAGESARTMRVLVIAHISCADDAVAAAPKGRRDLLVYGQGAPGFPTPPGWQRIELPILARAQTPSAARWLGLLRRRHYALAILGHPNLDRSRTRGPLLAAGFMAGARAVRRPDGTPVSRARALADLGAWALAQPACAALATLAATAVERVAGRLGLEEPRPFPPAGGPAVYLRTDLEIVHEPLRAGGSASHTEGIIRALERRGRVAFWSTGEVAGLGDQKPLPSVSCANVPTELLELLSGLRQAWALRDALPAGGFLYQRYSINNLAGVVLARRAGVPFALEVNASEVAWRRRWSTLQYPRLAEATERLILQGADVLGAVSANAAAELLEAGAPPARLQVVPNGVDVERFAGSPARDLGFPDGSFTVGFAGLFYPWHGVPVLARAFAMLAARRPDARLVLVGDGGDAPQVRDILLRAGLLDRVAWPGIVPRGEVPSYLRSVDVVASPHVAGDDFIGSPIKLFEYLASGTAIVASNVGQLGELLRDRETALLVPPGDPEALAAALECLAGDPELRRLLGETAQAEARAQHSWDARLQQMLDGPA